MKTRLVIIGIIAVVVLAGMRFAQKPATATAFNKKENPGAKAAQSVKTVESVSRQMQSEPVVDALNREPHGSLSLSDIPVGEFRSQLEKLPEDVRRKVLEKLDKDDQLLPDIDSLRVDPGGMIYYVCALGADSREELEALKAEMDSLAPERAAIETAEAPVSISSPPIRHSRPGASKVLFLDFNGHVVENTAWNVGDEASWDCRPYDTDGNETTFSDSEQDDIIEIWERVAEDYAPFDIDVTTEEPTVWNRYKGRVLITPDIDKDGKHCPHYGAGGVAYLDVFGDFNYDYYSPAWVLDYDESWAPASLAAEAASHEFGHNLDLHHDNTSSLEYYGGHANGSISWGPIMGTGYNRNVSQWSKGDYYDSNNSENDLTIISGKLSYRPDDYGDNNAGAALLDALPTGEVTQQGVIEQTGDPDVFYFATSPGSLSVTAGTYRATTDTWGGNLDVLLELYDSNGVLVATNNPALEVNAVISTTVSAGLYYLHVKPVGVGNPTASTPTGCTSYGSLGQYWITGMVSADGDGDGIPNEWEILYFGGFTNAVATTDSDGDGADNLTEYVSGYDPTDSNSVFKVVSFSAPPTGNSPFIITWNPVEGRIYNIGWSHSLVIDPFDDISGDLPYPAGSYTDTVERTDLQNFYRVDVRLDQ